MREWQWSTSNEKLRWPTPPPGAHYTPISLERILCDGMPNGVVFPEDEEVPAVLKDKGLTQKEWDEWVTKRVYEITAKRPECCIAFSAMLFTCGLNSLCFNWKKVVIPELLQWQEDFNREVLSKKGIFMKIRSHGVRLGVGGSDSGSGRLVIHALAFAYVPELVVELENLNPNSGAVYKGGAIFACCGDQTNDEIMTE